MLDFSRAFDTVSHHTSLVKLNRNGIRGKSQACNAACPILLVDGVTSDAVDGVKQGAVLGPIIILIHILIVVICDVDSVTM